MRRVRASSGHRVAAAVVGVTGVADMAAAGVTAAASEEAAAATSQPALPAERCCRIRCLSGFALAADVILCAEGQRTPRYSIIGQKWAGLDSNQRRRKPADLQ